MSTRISSGLLLLAAGLACGGKPPSPVVPDGGRVALVDHVVVVPGAALFGVGDKRSLSAIAYDAEGGVLDAPLTWTSSAPDEIAVDSDGRLTALTIGSAQVFAEAGGVKSAGALALAAAVKPGALLLADSQVVSVGPPNGMQYEVTVRNVSSIPGAGAPVLAAEAAHVAGVLVSVRQQGDTSILTLQVAPLDSLLADYHAHWEFDVPLDSGQNAGARQALREGRARTDVLDLPGSGFSCDGSLGTFFSATLLSATIKGQPHGSVDAVPGHVTVTLGGDLTLAASLGLKAQAGFKASGSCRVQKVIPIPIDGPLAAFVTPGVPIGVGVDADGKLILVDFQATVDGSVALSIDAGLSCDTKAGTCTPTTNVTPSSSFKTTFQSPAIDGMRVELSLKAYLFSGFDIVLLGQPLGLFEVNGGIKQSADLGFTTFQADDTGYASSYDLKAVGGVQPGKELGQAINALLGGLDNASFSASASTSPLSQSPTGTMKVDRTDVDAGGQVAFTIDLDPANISYFLLGYNVKSIELYRKHEQEQWEQITSIPVAATNQTRFQWTWKPGGNDVGANQFAVFVSTQIPVVELEIAKDSTKLIHVHGGYQVSVLFADANYESECDVPSTASISDRVDFRLVPDDAASFPGTLKAIDIQNSASAFTAPSSLVGGTLTLDSNPEFLTATDGSATNVAVPPAAPIYAVGMGGAMTVAACTLTIQDSKESLPGSSPPNQLPPFSFDTSAFVSGAQTLNLTLPGPQGTPVSLTVQLQEL